MGISDLAEQQKLHQLHELQASLAGAFVRADRVAEARGRLRRGERPDDDELARAIVADATGSGRG